MPMLAPRLACAALACSMATGLHAAEDTAVDPRVVNGWRVVRTLDCARCHGRDHRGLVGPSIIAFVETQTRERFDRIVLDGDPARGMPGYRGNAYAALHLDDMYRFFAARAAGRIGPDFKPSSPAGQP